MLISAQTCEDSIVNSLLRMKVLTSYRHGNSYAIGTVYHYLITALFRLAKSSSVSLWSSTKASFQQRQKNRSFKPESCWEGSDLIRWCDLAMKQYVAFMKTHILDIRLFSIPAVSLDIMDYKCIKEAIGATRCPSERPRTEKLSSVWEMYCTSQNDCCEPLPGERFHSMWNTKLQRALYYYKQEDRTFVKEHWRNTKATPSQIVWMLSIVVVSLRTSL